MGGMNSTESTLIDKACRCTGAYYDMVDHFYGCASAVVCSGF